MQALRLLVRVLLATGLLMQFPASAALLHASSGGMDEHCMEMMQTQGEAGAAGDNPMRDCKDMQLACLSGALSAPAVLPDSASLALGAAAGAVYDLRAFGAQAISFQGVDPPPPRLIAHG